MKPTYKGSVLVRAPSEDNVDSRDPLWPCISSVRCMDDASLFAVTLGEGIYRRSESGTWEKSGQGLPDDCKINRLQIIQNSLFACTSKGLFLWKEDRWEATGLTIPCFQVIAVHGSLAAATMYGVWCSTDGSWINTSAPRSIVYDLWTCTDYMILGTDQGISLYDRITYTWARYPQLSAVTGLAVFRGSLMGVTQQGKLLIGDQKGSFNQASFPDLFLYSIYSSGNDVYVCSDKGLFQLVYLGKRLILRSLSCGHAVTDIDICGERIYMATMCQGVQLFEK